MSEAKSLKGVTRMGALAFWSRSLAVLCSVGSSLGCASAIPPCPAKGGPAWREIATESFSVKTDGEAEDARAASIELETLRSALLVAAWRERRALPEENVQVLLVDGGSQWSEYFTHHLGGFFSTELGRPTIVLPAGGAASSNALIKHELIHFLSRFYLPNQPPWLAEGLATYFETTRYDLEERTVTVGEPSEDYVRLLDAIGPASIEELLGRTQAVEHEQYEANARFYASSWLLVHYLLNQRAEQFVAYQLALQRGASNQSAFKELVWGRAFDELDTELLGYGSAGSFYVVSRRFEPPRPQLRERFLRDAEVHVARAQLRLFSTSQRPERRAQSEQLARVELNEALRLEPKLAEAEQLQARLTR